MKLVGSFLVLLVGPCVVPALLALLVDVHVHLLGPLALLLGVCFPKAQQRAVRQAGALESPGEEAPRRVLSPLQGLRVLQLHLLQSSDGRLVRADVVAQVALLNELPIGMQWDVKIFLLVLVLGVGVLRTARRCA